MNYSKIDPMSIVDGRGCRVSFFISGCRNHCRGCFNPDTWNFDYGEEFTEIQENEIIEACKKSYISGLTILGGEPMEEENQPEILKLLEQFRKELPGKDIWMFTGYVYDKDLLPGCRKYIDGVTDRLLDMVDVLVDGPFILEQRDISLKFRGSRNQRLLSKEDREMLKE